MRSQFCWAGFNLPVKSIPTGDDPCRDFLVCLRARRGARPGGAGKLLSLYVFFLNVSISVSYAVVVFV